MPIIFSNSAILLLTMKIYTLILSALFCAHTAYGMVPQPQVTPSTQEALFARIQQLALTDAGTLSDATLVTDIAVFSGLGAFGGLNFELRLCSLPACTFKRVHKYIPSINKVVNRYSIGGKPAPGAEQFCATLQVVCATLKKIAELKESREAALVSQPASNT